MGSKAMPRGCTVPLVEHRTEPEAKGLEVKILGVLVLVVGTL